MIWYLDIPIGLLCALSGFIVWYTFNGIAAYINGVSTICPDQRLLPFYALKEDFWLMLPGSRGRYIRSLVMRDYEQTFISSRGSWTAKEVRELGNYDEVGRAMLPGPISFLVNHVGFAFGPLAIYVAIRYSGVDFLF